MHVKILGKRWRFVRCGMLSKLWGSCDPPGRPNKTIKVSTEATGKIELDSILHECTHAAFDFMKEETVNEFATDVAEILWRLGYRKVSE